MKHGHVLISVLFISLGLSWLPAHAGQDNSVQIRGPIGTDEVELEQDPVYGPVTRNDTLWRIATQVRPDTNVTLAQVMIALLHANPHAFLDNDPNALESGFMLRIPSEDEIRAIDPETARRHIDEGTPVQPRSASERTPRAALQATNDTAETPQTQNDRVQDTEPTAATQSTQGDDRGQVDRGQDNSAQDVATVSPAADAESIEALRRQLARSIENTERVLAENSALRARLRSISDTIDDMQRTMVAEDDFQQQIRQILSEQPQQNTNQSPNTAAVGMQGVLQHPWLLILLTFLPALLLIAIATLILRRKPTAVTSEPEPQPEQSPPVANMDAGASHRDEFELDEAMSEFDDLDDEGDDLAALEDEMLVPVEKDENDQLSLDDDFDDLNALDLSEFDNLDDELDDDLFTSNASERRSETRDVDALASNNAPGAAREDMRKDSGADADTDTLEQSDLDSLFAFSDDEVDEAEGSEAASVEPFAAGLGDNAADNETALDGSENGERETQADEGNSDRDNQTLDEDVFSTADEGDEETTQALQQLDDEDDFDFDRMVEQFSGGDGGDDDLNDDDIEALLAKSDQLVGPPETQPSGAASSADEAFTKEDESTGNSEGDELVEGQSHAQSRQDLSQEGLSQPDRSQQPQNDQDAYIDIESILAEADAEPDDEEEEPQSETSRRADAEDNLAAKLDLARAYLEMGEHEEARETIESVVEQAKGEILDGAKELLSRLDS